MSLAVWLPLNGDLHNQGLTQFNPIINTNPTWTNNGKIGQALMAGQMTMPAAATSQILNNQKFSFACWIYIAAKTGSTSDRAMIFGNNPMSANNNRKFSIFQYPTCNDLHLSWQNDTANQTFVGGVWNGVFPSNQWTHLAITYNNPNGKIYINGAQYATFSGTSNSASFNYDTILFSNCPNNGRYLNDYRIYDHALSEKEVEEIAKGLVLHYKLDNNGLGNPNLVKGNYSAITTATTNNISGTLSFDTSIISLNDLKGKTLYFSYDYSVEGAKLYNNTGDYTKDRYGIHGNLSYVDSSGTTKTVYPFAGYLTASGTGRAIQSYIVPADAKQINSLTFGLQPFNKPAANSTATWYIKNCKLEIERATSYTPNQNDIHQNSSIIYDSSGYGNNGIIVGSLETTTLSPRYNCATKFNGSSYIKKIDFIYNSNIWSISLWYLKPTNPTAYECLFCFSQGDGGDSNKKIAACPNSGRIWYKGESGSSSISQLKINEWTNLIMTCNGTTVTIYQNGNSIGTFSASTALIGRTDLVIGARASVENATNITIPYTGNLSDFRIYATALTAVQVKELYMTSMKIDGTNIVPRNLE